MYTNLAARKIKENSTDSVGIVTRTENIGKVGIEWYEGSRKGQFTFVGISEIENGLNYRVMDAQ